MSNTTNNYNLTKPLETERYDVEVFNDNADIIDTQMKANADNIGTNASDISSLASRVTTNEGNIGTNTSDISSLASRVTANEGNIGQVTTRVTNLESLNTWTTVEFDLDDFTYDEDSGITYLPIEAPDGYQFKEIIGYIILNCAETSSDTALLSIEPVYSGNDTLAPAYYRTPFGIGVNSYIGTIFYPTLRYNTDLAYVTGSGSYYANPSNVVNSNSAGTNSLIRTRPGLNTSGYSQSRIVLKTNVPNTNISEFYGKLQYRIVPSS